MRSVVVLQMQCSVTGTRWLIVFQGVQRLQGTTSGQGTSRQALYTSRIQDVA